MLNLKFEDTDFEEALGMTRSRQQSKRQTFQSSH